jgi:hypothetical protein
VQPKYAASSCKEIASWFSKRLPRTILTALKQSSESVGLNAKGIYISNDGLRGKMLSKTTSKGLQASSGRGNLSSSYGRRATLYGRSVCSCAWEPGRKPRQFQRPHLTGGTATVELAYAHAPLVFTTVYLDVLGLRLQSRNWRGLDHAAVIGQRATSTQILTGQRDIRGLVSRATTVNTGLSSHSDRYELCSSCRIHWTLCSTFGTHESDSHDSL